MVSVERAEARGALVASVIDLVGERRVEHKHHQCTRKGTRARKQGRARFETCALRAVMIGLLLG